MLFILARFAETVLRGNISLVIRFWGPVGIAAIFLAVGLRGIKRTVSATPLTTQDDNVPNILMYTGILMGFFGGAKMTSGFLISFWSNVPSYDLFRWALPCILGGIAGAFLGGFLFPILVFAPYVILTTLSGKRRSYWQQQRSHEE